MPDSAPSSPLSIATLNRLVRERLESGFPLCWVAGEISNLVVATSGHAYFTLKDDSAQVRCVMFRGRNQLLGWRLQNGQHVEARVLVTLYEARGDFQLNVETMRRAGVGNLYEQFTRLKARLEAEGLFAAGIKRPLPGFPRTVGIVTSLQAAALCEVRATRQRRAPHLQIFIFPTPVQGDGAGAQIAAAIAAAGASGNCDALIVCRGGGSIEDLWAFNDETVARAIRACPIPVVSGVGHETDFTIADFAADLRAPTPTAAAEIIAPERERLRRHLADLHAGIQRHLAGQLAQYAQRLDWLGRRLTHPAERIARQRDTLQHLEKRLAAAAHRHQNGHGTRLAALQQRLAQATPNTDALARHLAPLPNRLAHALERRLNGDRAALDRLAGSLAHLNPQAVLGRGYAVVRNAAGHILRDAAGTEPSAAIHVYLAQGRLDAAITRVDAGDRLIPEPPDRAL